MIELLVFLIIIVFVVISFGVDFVMVLCNSLLYFCCVGLFIVLGIGVGVMVYVGYSIFGVGVLVCELLVLFIVLKLVGVVYLVFFGLCMLLV